MRKIVFAVVAIMTVLAALPAGAEWFQVEPSASPEAYSLTLVEDRGELLKMRLDTKAFSIDTISTVMGDFARIDLDGRAFTTALGAPRLPVIRRLVSIPEGAEVELVVRGDFRDYDLSDTFGVAELAPRQPSVEKVPGAAAARVFAYDRQAYETDRFVFDKPAELSPIGHLRAYRVAWLEIRPLNYNPVRGTIRVATTMDIELRFHNADPVRTREMIRRYADPRTSALLERLGPPRSQEKSPDVPTSFSPSSYLIIGDPEFYATPEVQELAAWKTRRGYQVVFYSTEEAGGGPWAILDTIRDAYLSWERPPAYVLLLGDTPVVPAFRGMDRSRPATDLYYQLMSAWDLFPDIAVGRFPARTPEEAANMARKALLNESADFGFTGWIKEAAFMASRDRNEVTEGTHNRVIETYLDGLGYQSRKIYNARGGLTEEVYQSINRGISLLTYSGHGSARAWTDGPYFGQEDVMALDNDIPPLVFSYACVTGKYDLAEAFSETWLRVPHGALAVWAASANSYWDEDDILERAVYEAFFTGNGTKSALPQIAGMTDFGKLRVWQYYNGDGFSHRYMEMYNIMGDPEQMIFSEYPIQVAVELNGALTETGADLRVNIASGAYAMIGLSRGGESLQSAYADAGGEGRIEVAWEMGKGEELVLTVSGHNLVPWVRVLTVGEDLPVDEPVDDDPADDDDLDNRDDDDDDEPTEESGSVFSDPKDNSGGGESDDSAGCGC